jgi:hypothetical protein
MSGIKPGDENIESTSLPNPDFVVKHGGDPVTEAHDFDTPLEKAPVHPVPETVDEFITLEPTYSYSNSKKKWPRRILGGAAVLAVGAGAFLAGSRSGEESELPVEASSTTTTEEISETTETTETTAQPVATEAKLPTSDNPDKLLGALLFNLDCFRNTGDQACLNNYAADTQTSGPGSLLEVLQNARNEAVDVQKFAPEYNVRTTANITNYDDSQPGIRVIEFAATQLSDDGVIQETYLYDGLLELVGKQTTDENGDQVTLWLVDRQTISNGRLVSSE